jgi:hypothetical protein
MAKYRPIYIPCGTGEADKASMVGRIINIYDTYAHALAHAATGLLTDVREFNRLTYQIQSPITQTAKTAGPTVDIHSVLAVAIDTNVHTEVYLMSNAGRWGGPRRIALDDVGTAMDSESSQSESSREYSSWSSSSQSSMSMSSNSSSSSSSGGSSLSSSSQSSDSTMSDSSLSGVSSSSSP